MRGFLRNPGHLYMLDTDVVSIGRKRYKGIIAPHKYRKAESHIPLSSSNTDPYHAIIEKNHVQNCFILTDLNTLYGTFVNDKKLQNTAIRLHPGDVIRFGHSESTYEFGITNELESRQSVRSFTGRGKVVIETGTLEDLQQKRWSSLGLSSGSFSGLSLPERPGSAPISRTPSTHSSTTPLSLLFKRRVTSIPIRLRPGNRRSLDHSFVLTTTQSAVEPLRPQNSWNQSAEELKEEPVPVTTAKKVNFTLEIDEPW